MRTKSTDLSPHAKRVLTLLEKTGRAMTAYEILDELRKFGFKAPPTVYRALDALMERGLIHRIQSLGAFIACHDHGDEHAPQFAVCRSCKTVQEIHDNRMEDFASQLGKKLKFHVEREMLELYGLCQDCAKPAAGKSL